MRGRPLPGSAVSGDPPSHLLADTRRYELDWLRVLIVLGLIPYHVAVVFSVGPGDYIKNNERSLTFDAGATLVAFLGMPLLFVIAGAASWHALERRSAFAYLSERLNRLAIPLIFGILALVPVQLYIDRINVSGTRLNYLEFYRQFLTDWTRIIQLGVFGRGFQYWGHLWFLLYLLAVSLFLLPLLGWLRRESQQAQLRRLAYAARSPLGLLLLGLPLILVEVGLQGPIGPRPLVDYSSLYSGAAGLVLYAVSFLLGYLLVPDATFHTAVIRYRMQALVLAFTLLATHEFLIAVGGTSALQDALFLALVRMLRGFITWCLLIAALGYASRYLNRGTPLLTSLNAACFPLYVLHMPILTVLAYYVVRWNVPVPVKFFLLVAGTGVVTYLIYAGLIRRIPLLRFLFGVKRAALGGKRLATLDDHSTQISHR